MCGYVYIADDVCDVDCHDGAVSHIGVSRLGSAERLQQTDRRCAGRLLPRPQCTCTRTWQPQTGLLQSTCKYVSKRFIWRQSLRRESGRIMGTASGQDRLSESDAS